MVKFPYKELGKPSQRRHPDDRANRNRNERTGKTKKKTVKEQKAEQDIISFAEFEKMIPDEEAAIAFMEEKRWGQSPVAPAVELMRCTA